MIDINEVKIHSIDSVEDVFAFKRWLGEQRGFLAFDTETGGLDPRRCALRLCQFGDTDTAWVMRWDRWAGVTLEVLQGYAGPIVGHNLPFDVEFVEHHSKHKVFNWAQGHDSMAMAHILAPDKSKALKTLGTQFLSPESKKLQGALGGAMKKQNWGWGDIPYDFDLYVGYAGLDTILTARVAEKFYPQVQAEFQPVYDLEMQVARICSEMEMRGCRIDVPYCEEMYSKTMLYLTTLEALCLSKYGLRPSENQAVARKLEEMGAPLEKMTATGMWSMDAETLGPLSWGGHPWNELCYLVMEHRKKTKVASSYFKNFLEMEIGGYLYPSINTMAARTSRMSINAPALQTVPRGPVVHRAFIPRYANSIYSSDYDAMEMRVFAHFSEDLGMIAAILEGDRTGSDLHTEMARIAFNDPSITKKDERRQTMKSGNFAQAYLAGVSRLAATLGISEEATSSFLALYNSKFPGVKAFQKKVETVARQRLATESKGYVKTPLGRLQIADSASKLYTLVNYLVQGSCADVLKQALVDLDNAGVGEFILLPIHDEVLLDAPTDQAEEIKATVTKVMTKTTGWAVPLTATCDGPYPDWGAKFA